jgi:RNA polymerase sigma-54 factor
MDFGSYFQDYLDPGFRTASSFEEIDRPSFDNFLSQPSTLTDHLVWQLGSMTLPERVRLATDLIVGNLNEDGYLTATDEELAEALLQIRGPVRAEPIPFERGMKGRPDREPHHAAQHNGVDIAAATATLNPPAHPDEHETALATVQEALGVVHQLDPLGVGARDLRECLLIQIAAQRREAQMALKRKQTYALHKAEQELDDLAADLADEDSKNAYGEVAAVAGPEQGLSGYGETSNGASGYAASRNGHMRNGRLSTVQASASGGDVFEIAAHIVTSHLVLLQKKDMRELTRSCGRSSDEVQAAVDYIRTLDPRPGRRYNLGETRLIEPDVAFVKRDGEYIVVMNEEDMPTLRLSRAYRKMLREKNTEKEVREYVKERYKSAIQLLRNIEQRKNTIVRTCEVIVRRQQEFLERGEQGLKPMMIKEVAEEIGVHPSTVSRAVANKYVHTSQGVYELRFFFTEGVNGPEGGDLPLVLLKRKVKKLIEDEDPRKPLTDDQLAAELQRQGIRVTRRTVAKYREDLQIPSTHQRRVR